MVSGSGNDTTARPDGPNVMPSRVGHYTVAEALGEGGFGRVFAGWDERLHREVALKFLLPRSSDGHDDRLLHEARLAAAARHPALVAVYDLVQVGHELVVVMERVRGSTLRRRMDEAPISFRETVSILRQTAEALASLHAQGMVHGDLKPANLMIESEGRVRVLDFGLAARIAEGGAARHSDAEAGSDAGVGTAGAGTGRATAARTVAGTPRFMAPERLRGGASSATGDVFALGVLGRDLLACEDTLEFDTDAAESGAGFDPDSQLPARRALDGLLKVMVEPDPGQRLGLMVEVLRVLTAIESGQISAPRLGAADGRAATTADRPAGKETPGIGPGRALELLTAAVLLGVLAWLGADVPAPAGEPPAAVVAAADIRQTIATAEALMLDFDRDGAAAQAVTALESLPADVRARASIAAMLALAYCLRYADDDRDPVWLARAEQHAEAALGADDQLAHAWVARAWTLEYRGDAEAAEAAYGTALSLDPNDPFALHGLGRLLRSRNRFEEAEQVVARGLAAHPNDRRFWDDLGTLRYRRADYIAAADAFRHSIALKPDSIYAYANLSAVLLRLGRDDEALSVIQQGLRIRPHSRLYNNLGTTLYARGRYEEAAAAFRAALSDGRGSPNDYLKWANLADALRWLPEREQEARAAYARALALLEPSLHTEQPDATRHGRAALYAARLGRRDEALRFLGQAQSVAGDDADFRFRAVLTSEALGDRESSLEHLEAAIELGYPQHLVESDPDLVLLRRDLRYHLIVSRSGS